VTCVGAFCPHYTGTAFTIESFPGIASTVLRDDFISGVPICYSRVQTAIFAQIVDNTTNCPTITLNSTIATIWHPLLPSAGTGVAYTTGPSTGTTIGDFAVFADTVGGIKDGGATLPVASTSTFGIMKVGTGLNVSAGVVSVPSTTYQRIAYSSCAGTFPSSSTNQSFLGIGSLNTNCTGVAASVYGLLIPSASTLSNLTLSCGTTGVNSSSGVLTVWDTPNGGTATATPVTVTYGTTTAGTMVQDTTHTYALSPGDKITLHVTTQASETLANCGVSFNY